MEEADAAPRPHAARIVFIGFMAAGKTTLGRRLARSVAALWFDSDAATLALYDEAETVSGAFSQVGEKNWRLAERNEIVRRRRPLAHGVEVWSLGGGAVMDPDVQATLEGHTVVWLDAPVDVLWARVQGSDRPLASDEQTFRDLYEQRRATYESLSTLRVDVTDIESVNLALVLSAAGVSAGNGRVAAGRGLLTRAADVAPVAAGAPIAVVVDAGAGLPKALVVESLERARVRAVSVTLLEMGEWNKQISTVEYLLRKWITDGVHRGCVVLVIGGGTTTDTVGFAASIYQRGIAWVAVPTTLVGQVDAAIGGKTGVNMGMVKNVVGAFHEPTAVLIDPQAFDRLRARFIRDGLVEAYKTALLAGADLQGQFARVALCFERAVEPKPAQYPISNWHDPDQIELVEHQTWLDLIAGCAAYKQWVVAEDPDDTTGVRARLNLGHTLAHALEAATAGAVSHGAAVAVGLHAAAHLSVEVVGAPASLPGDVTDTLGRVGLPTTSNVPWTRIEPLLVHDKKRTASGIGWVLLRGVGDPVTDVPVDIAVVERVWNEHVFRPGAEAVRHPNEQRRVLVLFGANLGELGHRDPRQYGSERLAVLVNYIEEWAVERGLIAECRQTDSLERFLGALHGAGGAYDAIIVNPGAWTHYERALHDALEPLTLPRVEVHLSDIAAREPWRHESVIANVVDFSVAGHGADGYRQALDWLAARLDERHNAS